MVVMGAEEPDLTLETMASPFMEEDVEWLKKKFDFMVDVRLEVPREDERITEGTTMRVGLHEESLNVRLRIPMLPLMVELL